MKNINLMYFTRTMGLGGTEKVIMQLCTNFNGKLNKIIVCSMGGIHENELKKLGIKHYTIDDIENKNINNIIKTFWTLLKIIKSENINVIHTHHRMAAFYIRIIKFIKKVTFIHTAHNTFNDKKLFTKLALSKANIIAVGKSVQENLVDFYKINPSKINIIYNGIEKDKRSIVEIEPIQKYKEDGYFVVGNIGRLSKQKGIKYFVLAANEIIKKGKKIKFFIIGEGEEKLEIENLIKKLKLEESVLMLGYRDDVLNVMKQLDLVVLTSLWEGLPLTPIEAFSVGKTVIGTSIGGTSEIITNEYNGLLVESKNYNEIAIKITYLCENPMIKRMLEKNAIETYNSRFSFEKFQEDYNKYYIKILGG